MREDYQVIKGKQSINFKIGMQEDLLAVCIMDTGTREELERTIDWYASNFNHSIHVVTYTDRISYETISKLFPDVTFIIFDKSPNLAQRVNAMANECPNIYFYLTRTDIETVTFDGSSLIAMFKKNNNLVALSPLVFNKNKELIPTVKSPIMENKEVDTLSFIPGNDTDNNLYPFLGLGMYNKALLQRLRGFDEEIKGSYWQLVDFGTRCWLYGYKILSVNSMAIFFPNRQSLMEDRSECEGIERFYTKALCITINKGGKVKVKKSYKTDKKVLKEEVVPKAGLYKTDFSSLCAFWQNPQTN